MINRSTLALLIAVAALSPASMAFAQSRTNFGPELPSIFDGQGGRHYCLYGYDGPFDPPMASRSDENIIVCRSGPSLAPGVQDGQVSSAGARARAEAPKMTHRKRNSHAASKQGNKLYVRSL
jgi:hypothetical protein